MLRTMLAATLDSSDINEKLFDKGPLILQPKYDGIRLQYDHGTCYTGRSGKELRNLWITKTLRDEIGYASHFDGELLAIDASGQVLPMHDTPTASGTESVCMTCSSLPVNFAYYVFDNLFSPADRYELRINPLPKSRHVHPVPFWQVTSCEDIQDDIDYVIRTTSPEGCMFRLCSAPYKQGRSTLAERGLMKYKPFTDLDVTIVGFNRLYRNKNEAVTNTFNGLSERCKDLANLEPTEMLGSFICCAQGFKELFEVGTGFTQLERIKFWKERDYLLGSKAVIKYLVAGTKDRPRNPVWLRRRLVD